MDQGWEARDSNVLSGFACAQEVFDEDANLQSVTQSLLDDCDTLLKLLDSQEAHRLEYVTPPYLQLYGRLNLDQAEANTVRTFIPLYKLSDKPWRWRF